MIGVYGRGASDRCAVIHPFEHVCAALSANELQGKVVTAKGPKAVTKA